MPEQPEKLRAIEEAADFLGVKVSWLYEQVRLDKIPSYRVGRFRRFRISELEAWLQERHDGPDGHGPPVGEIRGRG